MYDVLYEVWMIHQINEEIAVLTVYDPRKPKALPWCLKWKGRYYYVDKLTMLHPIQDGRTLVHVFSVYTKNKLYFRLEFNTRSLKWVLKEMDDGLPN